MKKILIVVDYQNDFVDGALGFSGAELLDEGIAKKINSYPEGSVYYTLDTHTADYLNTREGKNLPIEHCIRQSHGWQVYGKTKAALEKINATAIEKRSFGINPSDKDVFSAFPRDVDEIELVGLVSNICVISNAVVMQSIYPEARITVDASLTGSFDKELNKKALDVMKGLQINVINYPE